MAVESFPIHYEMVRLQIGGNTKEKDETKKCYYKT